MLLSRQEKSLMQRQHSRESQNTQKDIGEVNFTNPVRNMGCGDDGRTYLGGSLGRLCRNGLVFRKLSCGIGGGDSIVIYTSHLIRKPSTAHQ